MKRKRCRAVCFMMAAVLALSGCGVGGQDLAKVDGLDSLGAVQVIAREEGSGTRSAFAELVGFDDSDAADQADRTAENAQIVSDTDAVISAVLEDEAAIGYISMGLSDRMDGVRALAVDGAEGTPVNVKSGAYPLSRPFCLAWSGELSELEQDFLTYVMGKGQEIVGKSYVSVKDSTTFLSGQQVGTILIHGSTSAAPLMEALAEEYMTINPHAVVEVTASDSTAGLNDAMQGLCSFGMASRELKDYEKELLDYQVVARDGIAVIVNGQNPLESVTIEELKGLFTGEYADWEEINTGRG